MKLIDDWRALAPRLWSIRLAIFSALLGVAELGLPLFHDFIPPKVFGTLSVLVALAAAGARLVKQVPPEAPEK